MFKKILVPLDGSPASECALEVASRMARLTRDDIVLVRATILQLAFGCPPGFPISDESLRAELESCQDYLRTLAEKLQGQGLRASWRVLDSGETAQQIIEFARSEGIELIVLASHGRSGFTHFMLGSVAETVCRSAPCPVLIVGPAVTRSRQLASA